MTVMSSRETSSPWSPSGLLGRLFGVHLMPWSQVVASTGPEAFRLKLINHTRRAVPPFSRRDVGFEWGRSLFFFRDPSPPVLTTRWPRDTMHVVLSPEGAGTRVEICQEIDGSLRLPAIVVQLFLLFVGLVGLEDALRHGQWPPACTALGWLVARGSLGLLRADCGLALQEHLRVVDRSSS